MKKSLFRRIASPVILIVLALTLITTLAACAAQDGGLKDGYYSAETAEFDEYGWKEYLTICVSDGSIVAVEYNAKNRSGLVKSWDMDYMRTMNEVDHTYPNEYTRVYSQALLDSQNPAAVDVITGATTSHGVFVRLAEAAIAQAVAGDKKIAFV